jgi:hypothetical protein
MAKIIDPDGLVRSSSLVNLGVDGNIFIDTSAKTVSLSLFGLLSNDGVSLQSVYSYLKEEWKSDNELIKYEFPMVAITPEQFEFVSDWKPADQTTLNLFRDAGFAIKNLDGTSAEEYVGIITLGELGASDQVYYQQADGLTSSDIVLTGPVNQAVKVYGDASNGNIDYRDYFKLFVREYQKKYAQSTIDDIGVSNITYQAYRFPLTNSADLKVTHDDTTADAYGVTVEYFGANQTRSIGGTDYDFDIIIDGNNRTAEEIYEAVQSLLRKNSDIDSGAGDVTGKLADELLSFVGDTLVTSTGVFIDDFQSIDINRIEFFDVTGTKRTFPFVAAGVINFNQNLVDDGAAIYKMFYTSDFGSASADLVEDASGNPIEGIIAGGSITFDYDYDGDVSDSGAGTDKEVTVVAIGLNTAQYVSATGTITRSNSNVISLVAALERNYSNL